jgi:hypothetical protein
MAGCSGRVSVEGVFDLVLNTSSDLIPRFVIDELLFIEDYKQNPRSKL